MPPVKTEFGESQSLSVLVERTGGLYTLPGVAMEVLELTKDPEVDAHKLKACIERDAALTVKLLRVVNSSLFGLSREVRDLGQAVAILGAKPLKLLVLGFSLPDALFAGLAQDVLSTYWQGTLCKAVAARAIGDRYYRGLGDEALIVGLLQDIGLLVMLQQLKTPFADFVQKANDAGADLLALEKRALGFDHTQLSRKLLERWKLPESIAHAVEFDPDDADSVTARGAKLHEIARTATLLARVLIDKRADTLQELLRNEPFRQTPFEHLRSLVVELRDKVKQLADVLNISWSGELGYEEMLLDAQSQVASYSESVLIDLVRSREETIAAQYDSKTLLTAFNVPPRDAVTTLDASKKSPHAEEPRAASQPGSAAIEPPAGPAPKAADNGQALAYSRELDHALAMAIASSRQERTAASLMIAAVNNDQALLFAGGVDRYAEIEQLFVAAGECLAHPPQACLTVASSSFALVLPHYDRTAAVRAAQRIIDEVRKSLGLRFGPTSANVQLCCGAATVSLPHKSFEGRELFTAAARCLSASQANGVDGVKSIEIY